MKYRFNIINCEKPGSQFNSGEPIASCTLYVHTCACNLGACNFDLAIFEGQVTV